MYRVDSFCTPPRGVACCTPKCVLGSAQRFCPTLSAQRCALSSRLALWSAFVRYATLSSAPEIQAPTGAPPAVARWSRSLRWLSGSSGKPDPSNGGRSSAALCCRAVMLWEASSRPNRSLKQPSADPMIVLEPISPDNALAFKAIRLRALETDPTAFGSTHAKEAALSDEEWFRRSDPLEQRRLPRLAGLRSG